MMAMRFSEAMQLGAMLRVRQSFGVLFDPEDDASCALGAAAEAIGILDTTRTNAYLPDRMAPSEWIPVCAARVKCPSCGGTPRDLQAAVIHLNNDHRWTREHIAQWVATHEDRLGSELLRVVDGGQVTSSETDHTGKP